MNVLMLNIEVQIQIDLTKLGQGRPIQLALFSVKKWCSSSHFANWLIRSTFKRFDHSFLMFMFMFSLLSELSLELDLEECQIMLNNLLSQMIISETVTFSHQADLVRFVKRDLKKRDT